MSKRPAHWHLSLSPTDGTTEGTQVVWPGSKQAWWRMARGGTGMLISDKRQSKEGTLEYWVTLEGRPRTTESILQETFQINKETSLRAT